jgi:hypothetical protein
MNKKNKISISGYLIYAIGITLMLFSFFNDVDGYGKALSGDFRDTWPYVLELTKNLWIDPSKWTVHFPLHYYLVSKVYIITESKYYSRVIFLLLSFITPYLFYQNLKLKYSNNNRNLLLVISSLIFFTPSFIYSAVWANDNNLSYIFMLIGCFFYLKQIDEKNFLKKNINIYISLFFFALVCYSRQYFAILYGYFIIYYYLKIPLKNLILISIYSLILATPGIIFLFSFPQIFGELAFSGNIFNTILGNTTSLSVYILPIILINLIYNRKLIYTNFNKYKFLVAFIIFIITIFFHDINTMEQNGGIFYIISKKWFNSLYPFYILFFINLIFIFLIFEKKIDLLMVFSIIFLVSGLLVIQKIFEPLFYIYFFLFAFSKFKEILLTNKMACNIFILYQFIYTIISISEIVHRI